MDRRILSVTLFLIIAMTGLSADPLWDKAVTFFSHAEDWTANYMEMESQQFERSGKLKETWEMEFTLPPGGSEDDWEMVAAYKNGHPATEKELKDRDKSMEGSPPGGYFEGVETIALDPGERERVITAKTGKTVIMNGCRLHVYEFTHTYESGAVTEGEIYLTEEGFPMKMDYEFTNLPFYMKKMSNSFSFAREGDAAIVDTMLMDVGVSFLFFNLNFMTKISLSEYRKKRS